MVSTLLPRDTSGPPFRIRRGVTQLADQRRMHALRLNVVLDDQSRKARLAYAIRSARDKRGLTPPQLADRLNVARGTVNKWESGEQVPSLLMLGPLCAALGVDANLFAVLPPIPAWEGESYLMDDPATRAARAALEGEGVIPPADADDPPDPIERAPARGRGRNDQPE